MLKWQLILMAMLILALYYMDCGVAIDPRGEHRVIHPEEIVDQVKVGLSVNYGHVYADVGLTPPWEPMSIDHAVAFRDIIINGSLAADKVAFKREVGIERPTILGDASVYSAGFDENLSRDGLRYRKRPIFALPPSTSPA